MALRFINTNDYFAGVKDPPRFNLKDVLLTGLAPGKGLYVPERLIRYPESLFRKLPDLTYSQTAFEILYPYFDEIPAADFRRIVDSVYADIKAPVVELYPNIFCLELFHNWTFAFKDFAAQLLAAVVEYYIGSDNRKIVVFVGTSGDTGPAIVEAFHNKKNTTVYCLFPEEGVTQTQRKQMTTLGGNIHAIGVKGDFHDCQELAKAALDDPDLKKLNPTSANSINWGRFIPQSVFSFWVYGRIAAYPEEIVLSIPTGNAGHIGSNFLSQKDVGGLAIREYIAPHNRNNYLVRMLDEGRTSVEVRETFDCLSNAMNVKLPNNIPRILYIFNNDIHKMQGLIQPVTIDDKKTADTIRKVYQEKGYILDVHSAVALAGTWDHLEKTPEDLRCKTAVFFTAHPAKFPDKIEKILGFKPDLPEKLRLQMDAPELNVHSLNACDIKGLKRIVLAGS